jgi:N-acetylmuramoyl-L-alanine amidase
VEDYVFSVGKRLRLLVMPLLLVLVLTGTTSVPAAAAANDTLGSLAVASLYPQAAADVEVALRRSARVTVTIRRPDGSLVRTLADGVSRGAGSHRWRWDGRTSNGTAVPKGAYRARVSATSSLGTAASRRDFVLGMPQVFPANPAAIVVSIDPGHGGIHWGAFHQGNYEKTFNLDIAFRLRALLRTAGVRVVMTRTTDSVVNVTGVDVNGDGKVTKADDLAARLDIANRARSDVHISIHNNASGCECYRGTEAFTSMRRTWTPEGVTAANLLHRQQLQALAQFRSSTYWPIDRGVKSGTYYMMSPYVEGFRPRPSQMPVVLMESLFVNNDAELALLKRPEVREALAVAFYTGIAEYINGREYGARYRLLGEPPATAARGAKVPYSVRVTNTGNRPSSGWTLDLRAVRAVPLYDGSEQAGEVVASRRIPDGLAPGQSVDVKLTATAPAVVGDWLLKAGVRTSASSRASLVSRGVPLLQVRLRTRN